MTQPEQPHQPANNYVCICEDDGVDANCAVHGWADYKEEPTTFAPTFPVIDAADVDIGLGTTTPKAEPHVHNIGSASNHWDGTYFFCDSCDKTWSDPQQVYEQGVADERQRHATP
jgi:hypothetical protein